jgi:hypothetical protein
MSIHVNSPKFYGKASSSVTRKETESTTHLPALSHLPSSESILIPNMLSRRLSLNLIVINQLTQGSYLLIRSLQNFNINQQLLIRDLLQRWQLQKV